MENVVTNNRSAVFLRQTTMMKGDHIGLWDETGKELGETNVTPRLNFEQAFAAHHQLVFRYAMSLGGNEALAEDVVQEVFIRLHQNMEEAQRNGVLRGWLLRVAANVTRNLLRGQFRARTRDEAYAAQTGSSGASPEIELLRRAEIERARHALAAVTEPLRGCLVLRNEGLSYREISIALDLNEASIGTMLVRARREFVRHFEKGGGS